MSNRPKTSYNKQLQWLANHYRTQHPNQEVTLAEVASWAIRNNLWMAPIKSQITELTRDLSDAMRAEVVIDDAGRKVRRNHCVRRNIKLEDGSYKQTTFWHVLDLAPHQFVQQSLSQRRDALIDKAFQMKQDLDSYNEFYNKAAPIQMSFDFTEDLEERQISGEFTDESGEE